MSAYVPNSTLCVLFMYEDSPMEKLIQHHEFLVYEHNSVNMKIFTLNVQTYFIPVENENHCDFVKLREMLLRVNMEDLREQTHARHYELYRRCKLEEMGFKDSGPDSQSFR